MVGKNIRETLDRLIADNGDDYSSLSRLVGRNPAYIQQFIKRGSPRKLPEKERGILAIYFGVDEHILGAPEDTKDDSLAMIPQLSVSASAGSGVLDADDSLAGKIGFDPQWLKKLSPNPDQLSLISVSGDSMLPTLHDGDDIMVDCNMGDHVLRNGIYVIRMDDVLVVKRVEVGADDYLSIKSDNPDWPSRDNILKNAIDIIGKVIWTGRRL